MEHTVTLFTAYTAPAGTWQEATEYDLAIIARQIAESEESANATEWSRATWELDRDGIRWAINQRMEHKTVLVARDEDGFYFATEEVQS